MELHAIDRNSASVDVLARFVANPLPDTFRYFRKRDLSCIANHLVTVVGLVDGVPMAYGHLDREASVVWLGLCVLPAYHGRGYGTQVMQHLIDYARTHVSELPDDGAIKLSVDNDNYRARTLYERFGFTYESECAREATCGYSIMTLQVAPASLRSSPSTSRQTWHVT